MIRLIKRYESRKLYDTEESKYVSLDEIAAWVRSGQEIKVIDNASSDDVTSQTLAQIILDEGRNGSSIVPTEVLRDLIRFGEQAISNSVGQVQEGMDRMVRASIDRFGPVREAREEMNRLRTRLEELEDSLSDLEAEDVVQVQAQAKKPTQPKAKKKAAPAQTKKKAAPKAKSSGTKKPTKKKKTAK